MIAVTVSRAGTHRYGLLFCYYYYNWLFLTRVFLFFFFFFLTGLETNYPRRSFHGRGKTGRKTSQVGSMEAKASCREGAEATRTDWIGWREEYTGRNRQKVRRITSHERSPNHCCTSYRCHFCRAHSKIRPEGDCQKCHTYDCRARCTW